MKSISYLFLTFSLLIGAVSCQKDGLPLSSKSARITQLDVTGGGRNTKGDSSKFQYRLRYTVTASLTDLDGVEEWGIFTIEDNEHIEFAFDEVSKNGTKVMDISIPRSLFYEKSGKRYIELMYYLGVYVKRKGKNGYWFVGCTNYPTCEYTEKLSAEFYN